MKNKKFELLEYDTIRFEGHTLHRIKALKDFSDVKAGDLGGYIEKEENLSYVYDCWVYDHAKVYGTATVRDNATIHDNVVVCDYADVYENAELYGDSRIIDNGSVYGHATIIGSVIISEFGKVTETAIVSHGAKVYGNAIVCGNSRIYDTSRVYGNAIIDEDAVVKKNAIVCGTANIVGDAVIAKNAFIHNTNDYIVIGPIGIKHEYITFYHDTENHTIINCLYANNTISTFNKIKKDIVKYGICNKRTIRDYSIAIKCAKKLLK